MARSTVAQEPHVPLLDNKIPTAFISSPEVSEEERKTDGALNEIRAMKEG